MLSFGVVDWRITLSFILKALRFLGIFLVKFSAAARPILKEDGTLVSELGQSNSLEGTLAPPVVSWGSWSGTKHVDVMANPLSCG